MKYLLLITVEGCVDVAQHTGSSERYAAPDSNADALRSLGRHGVINQALADQFVADVSAWVRSRPG